MILGNDEEPIISLCTPLGSGAIALLRISGIGASEIVDMFSVLASGKKLQYLPTHTIHYGSVIQPNNSNEIIDEVLFFLMKAPKTFTGQDTVEISCHNSSLIIEKIIQQAIIYGARQAKPGEFTRRAFLNEKLDLVQAEAIQDVITAQSEYALRQSMAQLKGSFSSYVKEIEGEILFLLGLVEASFEFLEEEQRELGFDHQVLQQLQGCFEKIKHVKVDFEKQRCVKEGVRIAIIGDVNVGKSTLFNALVGKDRAIVTDIAGTTRDCVEFRLYKDGIVWLVTDTAGLRDTKDIVEQKGIERARQEAELADVVLLVLDAAQATVERFVEQHQDVVERYRHKVIVVVNKIDCAEEGFEDQLPFVVDACVAAKKGLGVPLLEKTIQKKVQDLFSQCNSPFLLNQRQANLIDELMCSFKNIVEQEPHALQYELVAHRLREILEKFSELTGRNVSEKIIQKVFDSFCIGK